MLELVATEPSVAARLLRTLAATVRDLDDRLTDPTVRDVPARVATWLVRRALRSFERRGMIEIGPGEVTVPDHHALARVAAG
ncbi:hypothetical protein OHA25_46525 [Nonomuraea sp. NBC_00507]|uniref:hypothetical protein n=1 Tax=Nonomuraea sp. NBC_00507 TaxID=2976002 RepID=UPI002E17CF9D